MSEANVGRPSYAARMGAIFTTIVVLWLLLPNLILALMSFNQDRFSSFPIRAWTLEWWRKMLQNDEMWRAFRSTLGIGLVVAILAVIIGVMTAMVIVRHGGLMGRFLILMMVTMMVVPSLVYGSALSVASNLLGLNLGLRVVVIGHLLLALPFTTLTIAARLRTLDSSLEAAAATLGATPWFAFRKVTLPLLWPGMAAGGALAFALSFDEFNLASLTIGLRETTLPIFVFSQTRLGISPDLNALATMTIFISMAGIFFAYRSHFRKSDRAPVASNTGEGE